MQRLLATFRETVHVYVQIRIFAAVVLGIAWAVSPMVAQQKGQWVPGGFGLNAGVTPDPGFTYANVVLNYSAGQLNDANGNRRPNIGGTYSFWLDENIFSYVPKHKILGGYYAPLVVVNLANGSLVADVLGTNLSGNGGGEGLADMFVEPVNLGWHLKRIDINAGYGFMAPTGRFTAGASDNVGSGYWGHNIPSGSTFYITKNKGTSANLFTDWEIHGKKSGTNLTPGQAFTMEWGLGQVLPLKKDLSRLLQLGLIGYDQWQVSNNGGTIPLGPISIPASVIPYYSVHAIGFQSNFVLPTKGLVLFFKYEDEYKAKARPEGRTIVFGGSFTLRIPKPSK
jgi:hypothetical protein